MNRRLFASGRVLFFAIILYLLVSHLPAAPRLWWDEGWTLAAARNWVEIGHYGQVRDGARLGPGLAGHLPTVASAALSFKLFGVGIWQGRLPFAVYMAGAFFALYTLGRILFSRRAALAAVLCTLLLPVAGELHPILAAHQALGEPPMLFFLLAGCLLFWKGLTAHPAYFPAAALFWGLALASKAQLLPFFLAAAVLAALLLLWQQRHRQALSLSAAAFGGVAMYAWLLPLVRQMVVPAGPGQAVPGLLEVTGFVPELSVRWVNLQNGVTFGWWVAAGLAFAAIRILKEARYKSGDPDVEALRFFLFFLVLGWFAWYLVFGMLWIRYLFPVLFIGSLFSAVWLEAATAGFDLRATLQKLRRPVLGQSSAATLLHRFSGLAVASLLLFSVVMTSIFFGLNLRAAGAPLPAVAAYLDTRLPPGSLVETYDPEIMLLSEQRFHFPPDEVHVLLIERAFIDPSTVIAYDPLAAGPDYLLVGPFSERYQLYTSLLEQEDFALVEKFPGYTLYRRADP